MKTKEPRFYNQLPIDETLIQKEVSANGLTLSQTPLFKSILMQNIKNYEQLEHDGNSYRNYESIKSNATYFVLNDYASLGWNMAVGDVNSDGSDDLIMGAPVYSLTGSYQNGVVFIKLSNHDSILPLENIDLDHDADIIISAPLANKHTRFGHAVKVLDLNQDGYNDIVVSAPSYNLDSIKYEVPFRQFFLVFSFILFFYKRDKFMFTLEEVNKTLLTLQLQLHARM